MAETLFVLLRASLAFSLAVLAVLQLRGIVGRFCGAQTAYALWLAVPFAALSAWLPAPLVGATPFQPQPLSPDAVAPYAAPLLGLWLGGALASLAVALVSQARFLRRAARGQAGPAVIGVFAPRVIFPADFRERFTEAERLLIRLHERTHIAGQDSRINALALALRAANWFNPLAYLAFDRLRLDQEMACDARVMRQRPGQRRVYGRALLKAQPLAAGLPLGCPWPAAAHPLERRVLGLARGPAGETARIVGTLTVTAATLAAVVVTWACQPPRIPTAQPPRPLTILVNIAH